MKTIKFRVWDKKKNKYEDFKLFAIDEYGDLYLINEDDTWLDKQPERDRFIVEQFTGLTDKNGKEIYDGDIIRYKSHRKDYVGQVVFDFVDDSEGFFTEKHYGWGIRRDDYNTSLGDFADEDMKCEIVEVIGNIHENKELESE